MTTKIKLATNVSDVDVTTSAPSDGQALVYSSTASKWIPGAAAGGGVTVYSTINDLPLTGVSTGSLALVDSTNKLYLWMDTGWYNVATINTNPSITAGNNTPYLLALDGTPTVVTLTASDPEGIPLTWSYEVTSGSLTNGGGTTATVSNDGAGQFTITPTTTEDYAGAFSLTFKASDGVNLGTTVAAFTLAFRVLDSKYTSLLVKALASGANSTFVDSSTNNFTITKNGDTTQGTFSPFSQPDGAWSNYFDGNGDYLGVPYGAGLDFGTGDFTVEAFIFRVGTGTGTNQYESIVGGNTSSTPYWHLYYSATTNKIVWFGNDGVLRSTTNTVPNNQWVHVAVVRSSGVLKIYINGVEDYSASVATSYTASAGLRIGFDAPTGTATGNKYFFGHIACVRAVNGTAVYTSAFTPPTAPLTAITNTSLLTCQSNRFKDNSTNAFAITVAGNTAVSPFSPFDRLAYDPAIHGGGAYFDGTGDYLTIGSSAQFIQSTGFTVEGFVNLPNTVSATTFFAASTTGAGNYEPYWHVSLSSGNNWRVSWGNATSVDTGVAFTAGVWNHFALVMTSAGSGSFYLNGTRIATTTGISLNTANTGIAIAHGGGTIAGLFLPTGYMSNVRYVNNSSVYDYTQTSITVPSIPLTESDAAGTQLLLNCTNADIIDNDSKNNLKLVGNTAASSTQTKYAARSVYFDGTGDYILSPASPIGASDFTVEAWFYTSNLSTYMCILDTRAGSATGFALYSGATGGVTYTNNTSVVIEAGTASANAWNHIALVRSSGTVSLYLNGTSVGSATDTRTFTETIYTIGSADGGAQPFNGYIEDLRITKGLARYTANFTPPTSELLG